MKTQTIILAAFAAAITCSCGVTLAQEGPRPERKPLPKESDDFDRPARPSPNRPRLKDSLDRETPRDRFRPFEGPIERRPLPPRDSERPGFAPPPRDAEWLRRDDPEMSKLLEADREYERRTMDLAERYRRVGEGDRGALRKELAEVVTKHFEVRQQRRELELKRMDEQLARLRDAIKKRQESRQRIIDRRVSELVGSDGSLDF
jgi:hypothetical protein